MYISKCNDNIPLFLNQQKRLPLHKLGHTVLFFGKCMLDKGVQKNKQTKHPAKPLKELKNTAQENEAIKQMSLNKRQENSSMEFS